MTSGTKIQISRKIFNSVYIPFIEDDTPTQIIFGGSSSGKSRFMAQRAVMDVMKGGRNYLVCRATGRSIRKSVYNEISQVIKAFGVEEFFDFKVSEPSITCSNGYQILFTGLDDVEKLKSITPELGVITDVWLEEATEARRDDLKQLRKRLRGGSKKYKKRVVLTFNPILRSHWIYQDYFASVGWADDQNEYQDKKVRILRTWYIHNNFLTEQDVELLLDEPDKYYLDVYAYGKWGVLGDTIFNNWIVADLTGMEDTFTNHRNGLDFGFSSDPAALVQTHYDKKKKTIYVYGELYELGLTNDQLADELKNTIGIYHKKNFGYFSEKPDYKELGYDTEEEMFQEEGITFVGTRPVVADSSEPKSIEELRRYNINVIPAKKGKDSVSFGIQWLQQQRIVISKNCINAQNEFQSYQWRKDKDGNSIRQPVDKNNHIIDALRYAYEGDMDDAPLIMFGA